MIFPTPSNTTNRTTSNTASFHKFQKGDQLHSEPTIVKSKSTTRHKTTLYMPNSPFPQVYLENTAMSLSSSDSSHSDPFHGVSRPESPALSTWSPEPSPRSTFVQYPSASQDCDTASIDSSLLVLHRVYSFDEWNDKPSNEPASSGTTMALGHCDPQIFRFDASIERVVSLEDRNEANCESEDEELVRIYSDSATATDHNVEGHRGDSCRLQLHPSVTKFQSLCHTEPLDTTQSTLSCSGGSSTATPFEDHRRPRLHVVTNLEYTSMLQQCNSIPRVGPPMVLYSDVHVTSINHANSDISDSRNPAEEGPLDRTGVEQLADMIPIPSDIPEFIFVRKDPVGGSWRRQLWSRVLGPKIQRATGGRAEF